MGPHFDLKSIAVLYLEVKEVRLIIGFVLRSFYLTVLWMSKSERTGILYPNI